MSEKELMAINYMKERSIFLSDYSSFCLITPPASHSPLNSESFITYRPRPTDRWHVHRTHADVYIGAWNDNPDKIVGMLADMLPELAREFLNASVGGMRKQPNMEAL